MGHQELHEVQRGQIRSPPSRSDQPSGTILNGGLLTVSAGQDGGSWRAVAEQEPRVQPGSRES